MLQNFTVDISTHHHMAKVLSSYLPENHLELCYINDELKVSQLRIWLWEAQVFLSLYPFILSPFLPIIWTRCLTDAWYRQAYIHNFLLIVRCILLFKLSDKFLFDCQKTIERCYVNRESHNKKWCNKMDKFMKTNFKQWKLDS